jgi:hypothetical protein
MSDLTVPGADPWRGPAAPAGTNTTLVPPVVSRAWPEDGAQELPRATLLLALVAGTASAALLPGESPGIGLLVVGLLVAAAALPVARGRIGTHELVFGTLATLLLSVVALLDSEWLVVLAMLATLGVASFALAPGRSVVAVLLGGMSVPFAALRGAPWIGRGLRRYAERGSRSWWPVARTAIGTVLLLLVFGTLFSSADAAFSALVPDVQLGPLPGRALLLVAVATGALVVAYVGAVPPRWDVLAPRPARPVRPLEWAVPIAVLDLLFLSFVLVQLTVLFGGDRHVLSTAGLTYAEYARSGFGQLVVVTVLTLSVIATAARFAPRTSSRDRLALRVLLGTLGALALLVVGSALYRLHLYEEAFGFTRLRLFMNAFESWLGVLLLLVLVAGVRLRAAWLARAAVATGVAGLLTLAALGGDSFVAERNVARWEATGSIDLAYLAQLSADAVPAVNGLPEPLRSCVLGRMSAAPDDGPGGWNLSRNRARSLVADRRVDPGAPCPVGD